ncbi:MAG: efflux RND transporter periplasmic adaptor subunit [Desulfuromonadaceae bacterium]|nr:efflux RND transporter periplasmic adaptor subunit [Desulfuromonadaceae bacterium]
MLKQRLARFCILSFVLLLVAACEKEVPQASTPVIRPVKIVSAQAAEGLETVRYPAVIKGAGTVNLTFQVGGLLQELPVTEAQRVKQGELIAKLDQRDFISQVAATKAQFELAEQEYQRAVRLIQEDAIARRELEQRKSQRDSAKAQLDTAQKALADTELRAPYSGLIARLPVKRLQNVQPGVIIASMIDAEQWEATINLPASVIASTPSRRDEGVYVVLSAAPETYIPAQFQEATLEADVVSQTYAITFSFPVPDNLQLLPGMSADIVMQSSSRQAIAQETDVTVPLAAVQSDGQEQFVWVVDNPSMMVTKRAVTVQEGIGETLVITEGLAVGESIVAAGAAYLSEGMQVRPWTD